ncbi:MAG TPA: helicase-related protein, partial [Gemmatimonadaceae bacterium]
DAIERMEIVRGLRLGEFDVLVGINLLREGLDLPEVSLVAILDADQEGFLRSDRSLIQTTGRAARHVSGKAIFYADRMTDSMKRCIEVTSRRRELQVAYNIEHGITPRSVLKSVDEVRFVTRVADSRMEKEERDRLRKVAETATSEYKPEQLNEMIQQLEEEMRSAAEELDFELAARLRDEVFELKAKRDATPRRRDAFAAIRASK